MKKWIKTPMNEDAEFKICSLLELLTKYWQQKKKNFIYIKKS